MCLCYAAENLHIGHDELVWFTPVSYLMVLLRQHMAEHGLSTGMSLTIKDRIDNGTWKEGRKTVGQINQEYKKK